ncbi:class I SAM-dependent methyltransferase [Streptomyces sp. 110]|uniref:S-adenosyl-L-methionine-dependent methyltransferase n=1 Tax=Streptomyces endocoffeicus TaxID=2898945 RepID=A0ABS1Q194_9ACTN|nr:SAM-dependent methyltransferase [Streptomyces endocoffeicus]MBL1118443.1 class I SAM-dependent methyltransferase [Streptomyces endocoffeicus]
MRAKPSRTAQHVALFRALESVRQGPRLFHDPYAASSLSFGYQLVVALARVPRVGRGVERYIDERWPAGPRASAVVRTRLIDDLFIGALDDGARQAVLLGAGYDSRAFRLAAARAVSVLEVDHPATQAIKRELVARHVPADQQDRVRFVPVDFLREDLVAALRQSGFQRERTVVTWEGVTNYLNPRSVHDTLTGLASAMPAGSRVIFTYMDRRALDGTGDFDGVAEWADTVRAAGEPFTFGFLPDELPEYLAERGFRLALDRSAREAAALYLEPLGRREPAAPFYRIAQAEVR